MRMSTLTAATFKATTTKQGLGKKVRWFKLVGIVLILLIQYFGPITAQYENTRNRISRKRNEEDGGGGVGGDRGDRNRLRGRVNKNR